jgi:hypothetical protein
MLLAGWGLQAQNTSGKLHDKDRLSIGIMKGNMGDEISLSAWDMVAARIKQASQLNGLTAENEAKYFNVVPQVTVISKEATSTMPPMIAAVYELTLNIADQTEGVSYSQVMYQLKGVGKTEEDAVKNAFSRLNPRDRQLRAFFQDGKNKIIEYYNSHCDIILSKANGMIAAHKYTAAYDLLMNVPPVSRECYDLCMIKIAEFGDKLPSEYDLPEVGPGPDVKPEDQPLTSARRVELINGLLIDFVEARNFGQKLVVKFKVLNPTDKELNLNIRGGGSENYIFNRQGAMIPMQKLKLGTSEHYWGVNHIILPGTPLDMQVTFERQDYIRQFVFKANDNQYKFNRLPIIPE